MMSTSLNARGLDDQFWERLERIESRHQRVQSEHESLRRSLATVRTGPVSELRDVWNRYCYVIAELDETTSELEVLRTSSD